MTTLRLVDATGASNRLISPLQLLEMVAEDINTSKCAPTSLLIVYLNVRAKDGPEFGVYRSNLSADDEIALLSRVLHKTLANDWPDEAA